MYDKTFLLLFTLTIAWSSWHNDDEEHNHDHHDEITGEVDQVYIDKEDMTKSHGHIRGYQKHPVRIMVTSSIGTVWINVKSLLY